jgi:hypothetical protein
LEEAVFAVRLLSDGAREIEESDDAEHRNLDSSQHLASTAASRNDCARGDQPPATKIGRFSGDGYSARSGGWLRAWSLAVA